MTTDEHSEIDEWFEIIGKSINRIQREFNNFKTIVEKMPLTVEKKGRKKNDGIYKKRYS